MRKVLIVKYDMSHQGGSERIAVNLGRELSADFDVTIISMQLEKPQIAFSLDSRIRFKSFEKGHHRLGVLYFLLATKHLKEIRSAQYDGVICLGFETVLFPRLLANRARCKVLFSEQNMLCNNCLQTKKVLFLRKYAVEKSDYVILLSEDDLKEYTILFPKHINKMKVIYNWVEENLFNNTSALIYDKTSKKIMTVARISPMKNYEDIIRVATIIKRNHPDWHWDLYGFEEEEYGKKIRTMIKQNSLDDFLSLKGHVDDIYERYSSYSFLVHTAKTEPFGLAFIEAQVKGLPIIAYEGYGAMKEIISDENNGYLVPCGDYKEMARKVEQLITDDNKRVEMSKCSKNNLYKFEKSKIINEWKSMLGNS